MFQIKQFTKQHVILFSTSMFILISALLWQLSNKLYLGLFVLANLFIASYQLYPRVFKTVIPISPRRKSSTAHTGSGIHKVIEPNWEPLLKAFDAHDPPDHRRKQSALALKQIYEITNSFQDTDQIKVNKIKETIKKEFNLLKEHWNTELEEEKEDDVLGQAVDLLNWAVKKVPEVAELDMSDILMGKTVADIHRLQVSITYVLIDLYRLHPIHPIDRKTAQDQVDRRAAATLSAKDVIFANDKKITEALINENESLDALKSVTGIQVVFMGQDYVTFEGNGRVYALKQAFKPEDQIQVEVRLYEFEGGMNGILHQTIVRRINRVRRYKGFVPIL